MHLKPATLQVQVSCWNSVKWFTHQLIHMGHSTWKLSICGSLPLPHITVGPLYTTTLPGETDTIFYQMCLSFRRRRCFWGLKMQKNEPTLQSGYLKNAPPSRSCLKCWKRKSVLTLAILAYALTSVVVESLCLESESRLESPVSESQSSPSH